MFLVVGRRSIESVQVDEITSWQMLSRLKKITELISMCENLKPLEFMVSFEVHFDILQKLRKKLLDLKFKISPGDGNAMLIRKFTNLRCLHITGCVADYSGFWSEDSRRWSWTVPELIDCIGDLECLETLTLENLRSAISLIALAVEKGKFMLLQNLTIKPCPYTMKSLILQHFEEIVTFDKSLARNVTIIAKTLKYLCFFRIIRYYTDTIKNLIHDVKKQCPKLTFEIEILGDYMTMTYDYDFISLLH